MTETAREAFERLLAENPQFVEAPKTGQAVTIIGGGRPTVGAAAAPNDVRLAPAAAQPKRTGEHSARVEDFSGQHPLPVTPEISHIEFSGSERVEAVHD
jgi:hypothetical protein